MTTRYVLTANRLDDGRPVYFQEGKRWTGALAEAAPAAAKGDLEVALAWARETQAHLVCDPYVFPVEVEEDGVPQARSARETIRAAGAEATLARLGYLPAAAPARVALG